MRASPSRKFFLSNPNYTFRLRFRHFYLFLLFFKHFLRFCPNFFFLRSYSNAFFIFSYSLCHLLIYFNFFFFFGSQAFWKSTNEFFLSFSCSLTNPFMASFSLTLFFSFLYLFSLFVFLFVFTSVNFPPYFSLSHFLETFSTSALCFYGFIYLLLFSFIINSLLWNNLGVSPILFSVDIFFFIFPF